MFSSDDTMESTLSKRFNLSYYDIDFRSVIYKMK